MKKIWITPKLLKLNVIKTEAGHMLKNKETMATCLRASQCTTK